MASSSKKATATKQPPRSPESYASLSARNAAAEILQSYEKLSWYSFQRCESLTQTRLHFQNIVAGFTDADEAALVDWREDRTPHGGRSRDDGKGKGKERERERVSFAGDAVAGSSGGKARERVDADRSSAAKGKGQKRRSGEDS